MDSMDLLNRALSCSAILMLVLSCGADAPSDGQPSDLSQVVSELNDGSQSKESQGIQGSGLRETEAVAVTTLDGGIGLQGIEGSGLQGIQGSGLQGIEGSGLRGVSGRGVQGIQGSRLQGIQGSGYQ